MPVSSAADWPVLLRIESFIAFPMLRQGMPQNRDRHRQSRAASNCRSLDYVRLWAKGPTTRRRAGEQDCGNAFAQEDRLHAARSAPAFGDAGARRLRQFRRLFVRGGAPEALP